MSQKIEELFQEGIRRYESGEAAKTLIPSFESICKGSPKAAAAWTCLSWLYLLEGQAEKALKAAQTAVKLDPVDAQPRVNLTLAMLELKKPGYASRWRPLSKSWHGIPSRLRVSNPTCKREGTAVLLGPT